MNVSQEKCVYYIHYSFMGAFLEHLFWAIQQYLEKHAMHLLFFSQAFT